MRRHLASSALLLLVGCSSPGDERGVARSAPGADPAASFAATSAQVTPSEVVAAVPEPAPTNSAAVEPAPTNLAAAKPALPSATKERRPYREDIPSARMGHATRTSILDGKRSEDRVRDEERDSVARGRRTVPPRDDYELTATFASADELAQGILDALAANDPVPLHALHITREEFEALFWPEFPQSRPATGIGAADAWGFHYVACCDGVSAGLSKWGGQPLHLQHVRYDVGFAPYTNFSLYHGVVIEAVDDRGEAVEVPIATVFVERNGRWKVYMFDA